MLTSMRLNFFLVYLVFGGVLKMVILLYSFVPVVMFNKQIILLQIYLFLEQ